MNLSLLTVAQESKVKFLKQHIEKLRHLYKSENEVNTHLNHTINKLNNMNKNNSILYNSLISFKLLFARIMEAM